MTKGLSVVWSWWKKPNTNHGKRDANPHEGIPRTSHAPKWASPTAGRQPRALKKLNSPVVGLFSDVTNVQWEHRYRHLPTTELPMSARRDGMNSDEVPSPQQKEAVTNKEKNGEQTRQDLPCSSLAKHFPGPRLLPPALHQFVGNRWMLAKHSGWPLGWRRVQRVGESEVCDGVHRTDGWRRSKLVL